MRWNLDKLYTDFDSKDFIEDYKTFEELVDELSSWADDNLKSNDEAVAKIEHFLKEETKLNNVITKLFVYANLRASTNTRDEEALKYMDRLDVRISDLTKPSILFEKWLSQLEDIDTIIDSSPLIKDHSFILKEIIEKSKYLLSDEEEVLISKLSNTGSTAFSQLHSVLSSTLLVDMEVDGEEKSLPLPIVRNMAYEADGKLRRDAYDAELKAYKKIEESSAASLNGIKGEVITINSMRGYKSPLEETVLNSRIEEKTLDAMLEAMRESLPSFHKYYRKKAELLGHEDGLPFYDLFAPIGESDTKFTFKEARDFIVKNFSNFSQKLSDFAARTFDEKWIDAEPRDGKSGGAFCVNIHPIKESRILSNFTGTLSDIITLSHELGHAYHGLCLEDESILNSSYTMPIAETASIFCETIITNAALKDADKDEALAILENFISDSGQVIVDIYSRFLFESKLFEIRKDHPLSVNELKETMLKAQKDAYGPGLDENFLHPYMWICKSHYYSAANNFYNFPYAFGLLFAKGVYAEYLKRGEEFLPEYDELLRATGKNSIKDVAKMVDIDINSIDFWRSSLKLIEEDIDKFLNLTE